MKKYISLLLTIAAMPALFAQRMPNTREEKIKAIEMISDFFGKPTPSPTVVPDVISEKGLPNNFSAAAFDKQLSLFTNSFYFNPSNFNENEARIEADAFHLPNMDLIKAEFVWTKASAKEGGNLEIIPKNNYQSISSLEYFNESIAYKPQAGKTLESIEGTLTLNYPTDFKQVTFTKAEIGKEKEIEGEKVKLISIENDMAIFEISRMNRESKLNYYALNAKGEPLYLEVMRSEIPKTIYNIIDKNGKIPEAKKKELVDKFDDLIKDPIISYIKAIGSIAQLVVVKPKELITKKIPIKVVKAPDFQHGEVLVPHERYENALALMKYDKISEADLVNLIPKADRSNDGLNNHKVVLQFPNSNNTPYAKVEFKDVVATQAGKNVPYDPQGPYYDEKTRSFMFRLDPPGGDQPIDCDLIKGTITISYPAEINTQTFQANTPSENFTMATPITVKYFPKDDALDLSGNVKPMRAYASNGMLLKKLEGFYKGGSENDKSYIEYIYWGTPTSIQIDSATKWITKEIPFAVKPAPKTVKKY